MSETLPVVCLARHGETAWSLSGQHTGLTDLPLTDRGERNARKLGEQLRARHFARCLRVHCDAHPGPANWLASVHNQKSIATCSNGTTASTKVCALRRSGPGAPTGNCSATVVPLANRQTRLERGLIAWLTACVQ